MAHVVNTAVRWNEQKSETHLQTRQKVSNKSTVPLKTWPPSGAFMECLFNMFVECICIVPFGWTNTLQYLTTVKYCRVVFRKLTVWIKGFWTRWFCIWTVKTRTTPGEGLSWDAGPQNVWAAVLVSGLWEMHSPEWTFQRLDIGERESLNKSVCFWSVTYGFTAGLPPDQL